MHVYSRAWRDARICMHAFSLNAKRKFQPISFDCVENHADWIFKPTHPHLLQTREFGGNPKLSFLGRVSLRACHCNFGVGSWVWWTGGLFEVTTNVRSLPSQGDGIFVQTHFEWTLTWLLSWDLDSRKKPLPRSVMRSIAMLEWSPC